MTTHKSHYSILAILVVIYLAVIFRFQSTPLYLLWATIIFAVSYLLWGVIHHLYERNFSLRIMLEYLLVALLGVAIVSTLLV